MSRSQRSRCGMPSTRAHSTQSPMDCANLAIRQSREGHHRYAGITRLNLAGVLLWLGEPDEAARAAGQAQVDLGGRAVGSPEYVSAIANEASALGTRSGISIAPMRCSVRRLRSHRVSGEERSISKQRSCRPTSETSRARRSPSTWPLRRGRPTLPASRTSFKARWRFGANNLDEALDLARVLDAHPCTDVAGLLRGQLLRSRASLLARRSDGQIAGPRTEAARSHATISSGHSGIGPDRCNRGRSIA